MNIDNYRDKRDKKQVTLDFAESGRIVVLERRFREEDGVPILAHRGETDSRQMDGELVDAQKQLDAQRSRFDDLSAFAADIKAKEDEREKIAKGNDKKK